METRRPATSASRVARPWRTPMGASITRSEGGRSLRCEGPPAPAEHPPVYGGVYPHDQPTQHVLRPAGEPYRIEYGQEIELDGGAGVLRRSTRAAEMIFQ